MYVRLENGMIFESEKNIGDTMNFEYMDRLGNYSVPIVNKSDDWRKLVRVGDLICYKNDNNHLWFIKLENEEVVNKFISDERNYGHTEFIVREYNEKTYLKCLIHKEEEVNLDTE